MARSKREIGPIDEFGGGELEEVGTSGIESDGGAGTDEPSDAGESGDGEPARAGKRGRPRKSGSGDAGTIHATTGKPGRKKANAPRSLEHAAALLESLSGSAAKISGKPYISLDISECEKLVGAIDEFVRVWFPNAGKKIFDEKTSSAIALAIVVGTIAAPRIGMVLARPAQPQEPAAPAQMPNPWEDFNVASV